MKAEEVNAHVRRQPFVAFRLHGSDGASYDVRHPELILVTRNTIHIGFATRPGQIPNRSVYIDPIHVTRIERLNGNGGHRRKRR